MEFSIKPARLKDLAKIESILNTVWRPTYDSILSEDQSQFMLSTLFSISKMEQQMLEENHRFILALLDKKAIGFAAFQINNKIQSCKLHKLYLLPEFQGMSYGKKILDYIIIEVEKIGQKSIILNVNRANSAQFFYEKLGFLKIKEEDIPIGNGYFMNDFMLQLTW